MMERKFISHAVAFHPLMNKRGAKGVERAEQVSDPCESIGDDPTEHHRRGPRATSRERPKFRARGNE